MQIKYMSYVTPGFGETWCWYICKIRQPQKLKKDTLISCYNVTLPDSRYYREQLFEKHPLIEHLAEKLLNVFVSIEMTGQGVQFEQKFNYRRPMYQVLHYIWEKDLHKKSLKVSMVM